MRISLLIIFCFIVNSIYAQDFNIPKAEKLLMNAQTFIKKNKMAKAEKELLKTITAYPQYGAAYAELGNLYCTQKQFGKAADIYKEAVQSCRDCTRDYAIPFATALCNVQRYAEAEAILSQIPIEKNDKIPGLDLLKKNIQYGKYATVHPWDTMPVNLGLRINSPYDEYFPTVSPDDSTLYFTRRTGGVDEDFYKAHRDSCDDGAWLSAWDMGSPPNSSHQQGAQYISADGHYMFFMQCDNRSANGWEGGGCDLYFSYTDSVGWSQPEPFGYTINTTMYEGMPSLSSDNKEMFFVSNKEGGQGGKDIWVARFDNGLWQIPQNLGTAINTPYDETAPYIAPDNQTLYFTSNGLPGMGGQDIYMSRRNPNGTWQEPVNIGYPFNTAYDEVSFCISADGTKAYMASDRPNGYGKMDLYAIAMPELLRPQPYTYVVGKVYDSFTQERVTYAQIDWNDTATGNSIYKFQANKGDATYMAAIPIGRPFALNVHRGGYQDYVDTVIFNKKNIIHPDTLNFALLPYDYIPETNTTITENLTLDSLLITLSFGENDSVLSQDNRESLLDIIQPLLQSRIEYYLKSYQPVSNTSIEDERILNLRLMHIAAVIENAGVSFEYVHPLQNNDTNQESITELSKNDSIDVFIRKIE